MWKWALLIIPALPILALVLYVAGRSLGSGIARSWFEAKQRNEQQRQGGENADTDQPEP